MKDRPNLYDYLKVLAILTMVIDHLGYYFFPEQLWLRLIWRIAFPIFLFLVGFSNSYRWRRDIFLWGIGLRILQIIITSSYLWYINSSFNILISIALARVVLFFSQKYNNRFIVPIHILFIALYPLLFDRIDYGSFAIFFAFWWYLARHAIKWSHRYGVVLFALFSIKTILHFWFLSVGSWLYPTALLLFFAVLFLLFTSLAKENISLRVNQVVDKTVLFLSTNALLLYIAHIVLFSAILVYML